MRTRTKLLLTAMALALAALIVNAPPPLHAQATQVYNGSVVVSPSLAGSRRRR